MAQGQRSAFKANHSGRDYWSRRYGNYAAPGYPSKARHNRQSVKRLTRRAERRIARQQLTERMLGLIS